MTEPSQTQVKLRVELENHFNETIDHIRGSVDTWHQGLKAGL